MDGHEDPEPSSHHSMMLDATVQCACLCCVCVSEEKEKEKEKVRTKVKVDHEKLIF